MAAPFVYLRPTVEDDGTGEQALMRAALDGNLVRLKRIVKKLTKRNGDLSAIFSINTNGCNVLHLAACEGHLEVCRYLVEELGGDVNAPGIGDVAEGATPFMLSAQSGHVSTVKYFLDHGGRLGRLPVELAAIRDCMEEVEMLFPVTSPIPNVPNWTIAGVISHAKIEEKKPIEQRHLERRKSLFKSHADKAFKQKDYKMATKFYDLAIEHAESATLYANRSLCKLLMDDGEGALSDALMCRMLRPDWAKACYRQGAAHMLLKEYKQACDALLDAQNLDPGNAEIEGELRKARELMKNPLGKGEQ
ncbi:uncharacterized protein LOC119279413 [Triticum dicoccoides]|uniref:uncharacterized protein LOC119279413 n=1 Tax=Triticum dicoccoides TaxID=85692 RepID=UPI00188EE203|nr:uncharacterized protein LOC119279413 [Triticum dicoccoides]